MSHQLEGTNFDASNGSMFAMILYKPFQCACIIFQQLNLREISLIFVSD